MFAEIILLAAVVFLVYHLTRLIVEQWRYIRIVSRIPSTKFIPILGHMLQLMGSRKELLDKLIAMAEKNPSMFTIWLGPIPIVMLMDPRTIEVVLGSAKHIDKPMQYRFLEPWLGKGLLTSTGAKWHSHRKMLTPTFHFSILENFIDIFAEKSQILVKKLEKELGSEDFDIYPYIAMCALDIICVTAMGTDINAQTQDEHSEYITAVCKITDDVMQRSVSPWLYPDIIHNLSPSGRRLKKYIKTLHEFSYKVINERRQLYREAIRNSTEQENFTGKKKKMAFLDLLLQCSENGEMLTNEEIREEVDTFMFEGHDTTTAGISWALRMLGLHKNVQDKVYEELENIFQGSDRPPTMRDLNEMKYLERVIKEVLRKFPSVPLIARDLKEDIEIDGYHVPAGTKVAILIGFTHHHPEYYPKAEDFNPDNFLPERIAKRHPYAYIPFSAGPRNCIGQKFAILEEKMVLSYILRNYKVEAVGPEPAPIPELILRPDKGIHVTITKRETSMGRGEA